MTDLQKMGSPGGRRRIKNNKLRLNTFASLGPNAILKYFRERNEEEREVGYEHIPAGTSNGLLVIMHLMASNDVKNLPEEKYDSRKHLHCVDLAEEIINLDGFVLFAAIGEPALRAYIYHLIEHLGLGWCEERGQIADCLIEMYQRRGNDISSRLTWEDFNHWWTIL